jgi:hypothetical protein
VQHGDENPKKERAMRKNQRVAEMAEEVLKRQARERVERTGEPLEVAFEVVLDTEAGRQLQELRDGAHSEERAQEWQQNIRRERIEERRTEGGDR